MSFPVLNNSWKEVLDPVLESETGLALNAFLEEREEAGAILHPNRSNWFYAFDATPLPRVRVVILGQDPYHGVGQAHGLAFSVRTGMKAPPSLVNIFKEVARETDINPSKMSPTLDRWAFQGVLLLNTVLTVEEGEAASHRDKGWEAVTDAAISAVARQRPGCVFMLWGNDAKVKKNLIGDGHKILEAAHPSPLSAHRGFFGCGHFNLANDYFKKNGKSPIHWT